MLLLLALAIQIAATAVPATGSPSPPADPTPLTVAEAGLHGGKWRFDLYYPERSDRLAISGQVVATCDVASGGALSGCHTQFVSPSDAQFDLAAEKLLADAKVNEKTPDGAPTFGRALTATLVFTSHGPGSSRIVIH